MVFLMVHFENVPRVRSALLARISFASDSLARETALQFVEAVLDVVCCASCLQPTLKLDLAADDQPSIVAENVVSRLHRYTAESDIFHVNQLGVLDLRVGLPPGLQEVE